MRKTFFFFILSALTLTFNISLALANDSIIIPLSDNQTPEKMKKDIHQIVLKSHKEKSGLENIGQFPKKINQAIKKFNNSNLGLDTLTDLTEYPFVSIDYDDTKDIDQAIYIEYDEKSKKYIVHYAIADTIFFLEDKNSELSKYAFTKAFTTYTPFARYPVLPNTLTEDLCSLIAGEVRRAFIIQMVFNDQGEKTESNFFKAKIKNRAQLSYKSLDAYYHNSEEIYQNPVIPTRNMKITDEMAGTVKNLKTLGEILIKKEKEIRRVISFNRPEINYSIKNVKGENQLIISYRKTNIVEKYNEQISVHANNAVAQFLRQEQRTSLHRYHPSPLSDSQREKYKHLINVSIGNINNILQNNNSAISKLLIRRDYNTDIRKWYFENQLKLESDQRINELITQQYLITSPRAYYSLTESGHHGLQLKDYDHATAPIRRVTDLITHLSLFTELENEKWFPAAVENSDLAEIVDKVQKASERENEIEKNIEKYFQDILIQYWISKKEEITVQTLDIAPSFVKFQVTDYPFIHLKLEKSQIKDNQSLWENYLKWPKAVKLKLKLFFHISGKKTNIKWTKL